MSTKFYKPILTGFFIIIFAGLLAVVERPGYAQTPEATVSPAEASEPAPPAQATAIPFEQSPPGVAEVTLAQFNLDPVELRSPLDQESLFFIIPYRWEIAAGDSYLALHYDLQHSEGNETAAAEERPATKEPNRGIVKVYYNDVLATTFAPAAGANQSLRIAIPPEAIDDSNQDRHKLRFDYFSGDCDNEHQSLFLVHDHSFFHFEYELAPVEVNLADFPRPLTQNRFFVSESILLVIPDDYSDADLTAVASVAATIGRRTFNNTTLDIVPAAEATPERLADTSAIIIGQPQDNAFLADLYQRERLPTTLTADGTLSTGSNRPIAADDGVLQEVLSDFSDDHVYLIVTGANDVALTRAAQALSVLAPRYGFDGDLVVIADFRETETEADRPADLFMLADFGFNDVTMYGVDTHMTNLNFFIPSNWRFTGQPSLTLSYVYSNKLNAATSGLTFNLNGQPVGSAPIDKTVLGEQRVVIELPAADFRAGAHNRLGIETVIDMELPDCALPELDLAWVRISDTSQLYLPHEEVEEDDIHASLKDPLRLFAAQEDLSDVWFSLPETPTQRELAGLVGVASWLGSFGGGPGFAPQVSRGAITDTAQLEPYQVIAFGRPTDNPLIAALNDALPQPFMPGENNLRQEVGNVVYRLPDGFSLGLLQIFSAPWNSGKAVLVVTGTSREGIDWAVETLTGETYYDLSGDLAFIRADRLETFTSADFVRGPLTAVVQTMTGAGEEAVLEVAPTTEPTAEPTGEPLAAGPPSIASTSKVDAPAANLERYAPPDSSAPPILNQLIYGLIGAGLLIVVGGGFLSWRKTKAAANK